MRLVTDRQEARDCFEALRQTCADTANLCVDHKAAFRPGSVIAPTYFYGAEDIWIMPTDGAGHSKSYTRYWSCFGIGGDPKSATSRITIELNHPHDGVNRRLTGRFLRNRSEFFLAHTGRLGGGRADGSSHNFEHLPASDAFERVEVDGTALYVVGTLLAGRRFVASISAFVHAMALARGE